MHYVHLEHTKQVDIYNGNVRRELKWFVAKCSKMDLNYQEHMYVH
jgi:hypothetical protein